MSGRETLIWVVILAVLALGAYWFLTTYGPLATHLGGP